MESKQRIAKRVLVLSGGGGRGAYQIVAPDHYLTVGLMTHYQAEYHRHLFDLGYWDARKDLANVLPLTAGA